MKRLKLITKYFVKSALQNSLNNSKMKPWQVILLSIFVLGCLSMPFAGLITMLYKPFEAMGQEGYLISLLLVIGSTLTFVIGIYTILNVFYFANDIEQILPLPFKSSEIVFGKFLAVLIDMYLYTSVLVLPLIAYGVSSKAGVAYYLYAVLALLIIPILPMIVAALICMLLMRFTGLSKHKDAFRMFAGTLMFVLIIGFNFFSQSSSGNSEEIISKLMSKGNNSLMDVVNSVLITNKLASYGLLYNKELRGLLFILGALVIAVALFVIYYIVGGKLYYKGVVGISETYSKRENVLNNKDADKLMRASSPVKALIKKDIKIIFRTPQYFINCIVILFYMPAILGMVFFTKDGGALGQAIYGKEELYGYVIVAVLAFSIMCVSAGGAALTAVSREGKDFMISKYIPISGKEFLKSKVISSILINEISSIIVIGMMIFLNLPISLIILGSIISVGSVGVISLLELYLDYKSPRLDWESERDMFKKNYIPLFLTLGTMVIGVAFGALAFFVKNYLIIFVVAGVLLVITGTIIVNLLNKACRELYS